MDIKKAVQEFRKNGGYILVGVTAVIGIIEAIDKLNKLLPRNLAIILFCTTLICFVVFNWLIYHFKSTGKAKGRQTDTLKKVHSPVNIGLTAAGVLFSFYAFLVPQPNALPVFDINDPALKIAIFPLSADIKSRHIDANYVKQIHEYLDNKHTGENYNFKALFPSQDSIKIPETKEESIALGKLMNADVVVWGSYEEVPNGIDSVRIQYAITDNFTTYIDAGKRETDTEMQRLSSLSQLRQGYLLGNVDYIINWFEGMAAFKKYDYNRAVKYFDKTLSIDHADKYESPTSHILINIYYELRRYSTAKAYCEKLIAKQEREGGTTSDEHSSTLIMMGTIFKGLNNDDSAWVYLRKGAQKIEMNPVTDSMVRALSYSDFGTFFYAKKDNGQALTCYQKALPYFNEKNPLHAIGLAILNYNIGIIKADEKLNDEGLAFIKKANDIQNNIPNPNIWFSAKIYNVLGNLFSQKGEVKTALRYYKKALDILVRLHNDDDQLASLCTNVGNLYIEMKQNDSSLKYNYQALSVMKKNNDTLSTLYANILINLSEALKYKGNNREALKLTQNAEKIYLSYPFENVPNELITVYINIAELTLLLESLDTCKTYLDKTSAIIYRSILNKKSTHFNPQNYLIGYYYWACAKLERRKNNTNQALVMGKEAYRILALNFPKDYPDVIELKKLINSL